VIWFAALNDSVTRLPELTTDHDHGNHHRTIKPTVVTLKKERLSNLKVSETLMVTVALRLTRHGIASQSCAWKLIPLWP
jgi:hypothetical protein